MGYSLITYLYFAVEVDRSLLNCAFCTGPRTVRVGSLTDARQPAGGDGGRNKLNGNSCLIDDGTAGARSSAHGSSAPPTSALRHERSSKTKISASLPQRNVRYSGSPAHDASLSRPVSRIGQYSRNASRPAA